MHDSIAPRGGRALAPPPSLFRSSLRSARAARRRAGEAPASRRVLGRGAAPRVARRGALALACLAALGSLAPFAAATTDPDVLEGERWLREYGCTSCHAAPPALAERLAPIAAPILDTAGSRLSADWLRRWLRRPHELRPDTRMPDMLAELPDAKRNRVVHALVGFLAKRGEPLDDEPVRAGALELERGRELFHTIGCVACHGEQESADALDYYVWDLDSVEATGELPEAPPGAWDETLPTLERLGSKTTVAALTEFLLEPRAVRPSGRMPHLRLERREARAIALYLTRKQALRGGDGLEFEPGLRYQSYEAEFAGARADFAALTPIAEGVVATLDELPAHRDDRFGFRFTGFFVTERGGLHRFATTSDDGSILRVDGEELVDNSGHHPMVRVAGERWLDAGRHALEIEYFEHTGGEGLEVRWQPPGEEQRAFRADELSHASLVWTPPVGLRSEADGWRVARGRALFEDHGCVQCHALDTPTPPSGAPPLVELDPTRGCLAEDSTREYDADSDSDEAGGVPPESAADEADGNGRASATTAPVFALDAQRRAQLARALAAVRDGLAEPSAREALALALREERCLACHRRDDTGGPDAPRRAHFLALGEHDMGNEGRFPPSLDHVGAKLWPDPCRDAIADGQALRPYLATRMPSFGDEVGAHIAELFERVDATDEGRREPPFSQSLAAVGRQLVGTGGLGCVQCHGLAGYPSLGIPAVDLAGVHARIQPGWFRQLLLDPKSLGMNTRMPEFLVEGRSPVRDVYDGDPTRQADAIRAYLSLGEAMPLPNGLATADATYELTPDERVVLCSVFMAGVSPRTLLVGHPEGVHFAFDVENSRLVRTWHGRFFNARGTWHGRAGAKEKPGAGLGVDFPEGASVAWLDEGAAPWPKGRGREAGLRPAGYSLDAAGRPTFRYRLDELAIEESLRPLEADQAKGVKGAFARRWKLSAPREPNGVYLRAWAGPELEEIGEGRFALANGGTARLAPGAGGYLCQVGGGRELRVPVVWSRRQSHGVTGDGGTSVARAETAPADLYEAVIEMEVSW